MLGTQNFLRQSKNSVRPPPSCRRSWLRTASPS